MFFACIVRGAQGVYPFGERQTTMTGQLQVIQRMLEAAQVVLEQCYTLTTQLAAPPMAEDAASGYEHYHALAQESLTIAQGHLTDVAASRQATTVKPLLVIDCGRTDWVYLCGHPVRLRPVEFRMLLRLAQTPRKVVRYAALYTAIWADDVFVEPGQMYTQGGRLRRKLEGYWPPEYPPLLQTTPRVGLVLNIPDHQLSVVPVEEPKEEEVADVAELDADTESECVA
jgi:DNA-binding winged helix-turn-helix (wHTH) protein